MEIAHFGSRVEGVIVTPLRPPEDVWQSWCRRGNVDPDGFVEAWRLLDEHHGVLMPMGRDEYLPAVCETTDLNVAPTFPRLNRSFRELVYLPPMPKIDSPVAREVYE
ncbi:MAG: hypothetical protein V2J24_20170 [Pseudomonadales bacterium]|nr:hypothetical protein [Pseudomonadales bacterium]